MIATLPPSVVHHFSVRQVGKVLRATCNRCSWRMDFQALPITPETHARLIRHVDHHTQFDATVLGRMTEPDQVAPGPEQP